jgi:16S rRNA (guanine527-N7)-methyltransferase
VSEELLDPLRDVLARSHALGFLGPGDPMFHVEHALGFGDELDGVDRVVDLGSGGGVPGLVLAVLDDRRYLLLDAMQKRCAFLESAVADLGLEERVEIVCARAEDVGRDGERRAWADAVVSRSFGKPAVAAECAAPLLRPGGRLVVSEPPDADRSDLRWVPQGLARLGLVDEGGRQHRGSNFRRLRQDSPCPDDFPRRAGVPSKRPLF